jgi:hypothetical protein
MKTVIYSITNTMNNKRYIGSSKSYKRRWYEHLYQLKNNYHHSIYLQRTYNKYGKSILEFEILEECTIENRKERELYYITLYKAFDKNYGYNNQEPNKERFKHSDETKEKMFQSRLKGYKVSPIDVYLIDGTFYNTFRSIKACSECMNIPQSVIYRIFRKEGKQFKGYTFFKNGEKFSYTPSKMQRDMSNFIKNK